MQDAIYRWAVERGLDTGEVARGLAEGVKRCSRMQVSAAGAHPYIYHNYIILL